MTMRRTKIAVLALATTALLAGCAALGPKHPVGNSAVPQPAKPVELSKYLGKWYEIARYEQSFQKGCEGVSAEYALRSDGMISVRNACRRPDGKLSVANGKAKVVDAATNAKLKVSFFGPFYGNYWVLDRAEDYSWAIVGEPSGRYLWLLAREATPAPDKIEAQIARAKSLGYDTSMLIRTKQP